MEQIGNSNQATLNQQSGTGSNTSYVWQGYGGTNSAAYNDIATVTQGRWGWQHMVLCAAE